MKVQEEVAALLGRVGLKAVVLRPRHPEAKGQAERTIRYLETSFLPLRQFAGLEDLRRQHDFWARTVAFERRPRRLAGTVADAWRVERAFLAALPQHRPSTDRQVEARVSRDGFVRVASADYSVPPGLAGRRVAVTSSPTEIVVRLEGVEVARHTRSWVPADVVLAPAHVRALRLHRQAKARLQAGDVAVPAVDLGNYDRAVGVAP